MSALTHLRCASVRAVVASLVAAAAAGCAGRGGPPPADGRSAELTAASARIESLERETQAQSERIRELEGHLALARAESRELSVALERHRAAPPPRETVRIGAEPREAEEAGGLDVPTEEPAEDEPRPVLRLYGTRADLPPEGGGEAPPLVVPAPPPGVSLRVPVRTMAWDPRTERAPAQVPSVVSSERAPAGDGERPSYERALRLLTDRRFAQAVEALDAHLGRFPDGVHATSALYWRGEAHYALRHYDRALADFRRVVERSPRGRRAPDALYKIALCHRRRGDVAAARAVLETLRREHPESVAARLAAQEDAS